MSERRTLQHFLPSEPLHDADEILDRFLSWIEGIGFELYAAQEEALLELMADRHVILDTPTGSGKSLVALGLKFRALCENRRIYYTTPIKALASEKFFSLCRELSPERVGMLTGDASINPEAPVICCTAEVLANLALRKGPILEADYVVMDEFHYYADRERGPAWQIPLIILKETQFLLMSATLGNTSPIAEAVEKFTGRKVARVVSRDRPVPLAYEYREVPLNETVEDLCQSSKAPIYIVNFTQRACSELAQSLTSLQITTKEERRQVRAEMAGARFDTPFGKEIKRFLGFGIAVHNAGLLPKYRLLVERLAQKGLLKVISGTDTLGVGVNIPIRTVLFSKLCKYDGRKVGILSVRQFKQIAGRAGRRGFDTEGWVICQAPEHEVENKRLAAKSGGKKKVVKKKPPTRGFVPWNEATFKALRDRQPEPLKPRFHITAGMIIYLLQRDTTLNDPNRGNFSSLRELIAESHTGPQEKRELIRESAQLVLSLHRAGILKMVKDTRTNYRWINVDDDLQWDFSLFQTLSLFMVEAIDVLDTEDPEYHLQVLSLVESILEEPRVILLAQQDKARGELIARLKAERVPYEERMDQLEDVTYPKPEAEWIEGVWGHFREANSWVRSAPPKPKSIGREMFENYLSFTDFVKRYGLKRAEGVLLRYLSQLYKTLDQSVPERARTESLYDVIGYFQAMLEKVDTSLIEEWRALLHPELGLEDQEKRQQTQQELRQWDLFHDPRAFAARIRAELHQMVRDLAQEEYEEAASGLVSDPLAEVVWDVETLEEAFKPYCEEHGKVIFDGRVRQAHTTRIEKTGDRKWEVTQVLVDEEGDNLWHLAGSVDLNETDPDAGRLFRLRYIGV